MSENQSNSAQPIRPKRFRKRYIINKRFQFAFIGRMMLLAVTVLALVYGTNNYFFWQFENSIRKNGISENHIIFNFLEHQNQQMNSLFLISAGVIFLAITVFGILYSHRIAGPLYRLHKSLYEMASSHSLKRISFRKRDYFPEVATAFNHLVDALQQDQEHDDKEDGTRQAG